MSRPGTAVRNSAIALTMLLAQPGLPLGPLLGDRRDHRGGGASRPCRRLRRLPGGLARPALPSKAPMAVNCASPPRSLGPSRTAALHRAAHRASAIRLSTAPGCSLRRRSARSALPIVSVTRRRARRPAWPARPRLPSAARCSACSSAICVDRRLPVDLGELAASASRPASAWLRVNAASSCLLGLPSAPLARSRRRPEGAAACRSSASILPSLVQPST